MYEYNKNNIHVKYYISTDYHYNFSAELVKVIQPREGALKEAIEIILSSYYLIVKNKLINSRDGKFKHKYINILSRNENAVIASEVNNSLDAFFKIVVENFYDISSLIRIWNQDFLHYNSRINEPQFEYVLLSMIAKNLISIEDISFSNIICHIAVRKSESFVLEYIQKNPLIFKSVDYVSNFIKIDEIEKYIDKITWNENSIKIQQLSDEFVIQHIHFFSREVLQLCKNYFTSEQLNNFMLIKEMTI